MSAKELNIGDYVRTKYGIAKIESFELKNKEMINLDKDIMFCNMDIYRNHCSINQVIKSSSNIIDLIEVGDYVNGIKVDNVDNSILIFYDSDGDWYITNSKDIKSIVTCEMFESMEYKIEE